LIVENGYSLVKINNAAYKPLKLALWGQRSKPSPTLHLFLRTLHGCRLLDNADGTGSTLLDNAGAYYPEHIVLNNH
jgi:hypothetical protein